MPREICVECGLTTKPDQNGVTCIEFTDQAKTSEVRIWSGDIWKCPGCQKKTVILAQEPFAESHHEDFAQRLVLARSAHWIEFY